MLNARPRGPRVSAGSESERRTEHQENDNSFHPSKVLALPFGRQMLRECSCRPECVDGHLYPRRFGSRVVAENVAAARVVSVWADPGEKKKYWGQFWRQREDQYADGRLR